MRSRNRQIRNLIVVIVIACGLIAGMEAVAGLRTRRLEQEQVRQDLRALLPADAYLAQTVDPAAPQAAAIEEVYQAQDETGAVTGHLVVARVPGYADDLLVRVAFHADARTILGVRLLAHQEAASSGGQAALPFFTTRFVDKQAPLFLTGEQPAPAPAPRVMRDGTYTTQAVQTNDQGYLYTFEMIVEDGIIRDARWDGVSAEDGALLRQASADGTLPLEDGALPWHEQAIALESVLLQVQDPALIGMQADGSIANAPGLTMRVAELLALAEICVSRAAMPSALGGTPQDGLYRADADEPDRDAGYRDFVEIRVEEQRVASIVWDAERADGSLLSRDEDNRAAPADGLPWGEQAARVAAFLLERQDPTIVATQADGTSDEIPEVTIPIDLCLDLTRACLLQAGMYAAVAPTPQPPDTSGQVDAIAGATITSRAMVQAVNTGYAYLDGILTAPDDTHHP